MNAAAGKPARNVLLVTLVPPHPPTDGHKIHLWNLVRALCAEGWSITLVSLTDNAGQEIPEALSYLCREVEFVYWRPGSYALRDYRRRLAALLSGEPFHVRQSSQPQLAAAVARRVEQREFAAIICDEVYTLPSLPAGLAVPVIVDTQHVAYELLRRYARWMPGRIERLYARMEAGKMRRWEAREGRKAFALGATSQREAALFREICPATRVVPLPNVVDVAQYEPWVEREQEDVVLFAGNMDWFPNRDGVEFFVTGILPELHRLRPQARFRVAGSCHSAEFIERIRKHPHAEMVGFVEDMRREMARATVCAMPLRIASGTRLKILEAAAMAKAMVSTSAGAEGLDFKPGAEIVIADEPGQFARALAELLADAGRRREMGERARRRVERDYSLAVLRSALCAVLDPLAQPRSLAARGGVSS
ncbi:MAG TPA: glycosyltransferase family 4 protein [Patescibacteria group bacterium]|nr:glycosyltransferase family 4 protein [Patescibacteria group bacterium]